MHPESPMACLQGLTGKEVFFAALQKQAAERQKTPQVPVTPGFEDASSRSRCCAKGPGMGCCCTGSDYESPKQ